MYIYADNLHNYIQKSQSLEIINTTFSPKTSIIIQICQTT